MAILFVASESAELKPFASLLTNLRKLKWPVDYAWEGILDGRRILLAANGAGPKLAAQAVEIAIRAGMAAELSSSRLEVVVSTGFCGALDPALSLSQIIVATQVFSSDSRETFECLPIDTPETYSRGILVSQNHIASTAEEKSQLTGEGGIGVEMEAAGVALRAKRARLPFCCIKVVSDVASYSFPFDPNTMRTQDGRIVRGKIVKHALTHPSIVPSLLKLKRDTEDAAKRLGDFLASCRIVGEPVADSVGFTHS